MEDESLFKTILNFFSSRIVILCIVMVLSFSFLILKLFDIQIINGEKYNSLLKRSVTRHIEIDAPRGAIYDKFGKPLAVNTVAYSVKIDDTVRVEDKNESILELIEILDANGEQIIDEMPITTTAPYQFLFDGSKRREERWKKDMGLESTKQLLMSADECYEYLRNEIFKIPEGLTPETERKLMAIRQSLALNRYNFNQLTIAKGVKNKTIAMIEEQKHKFLGAVIDVEPLRVYPEGSLFSHIIGYIRSISDTQLEEYKDYGYKGTEQIGQLGVEKAMELRLKGTNGNKTIEADSIGRVVRSEITEPAIPGDKVFLTIDTEFQKKCAQILRKSLVDVIVSRLGSNTSIKDACISLVKVNKKTVEAAFKATEDKPELLKIKQAFINDVPEFDITDDEKLVAAKELVAEKIENGDISTKTVVLALFEMGMLTGTEDYIASIKNGAKSPLTVFREKLQSGELEPSYTGIDPSTAGLAVVDVKTGGVVALVTYPSYDNNQLVNIFNVDYYNDLRFDESSPFINRPLSQRKAPGSTFKMIPAVALLEEKIVTPWETIYDYGEFTKAGRPYAKCWIHSQGGNHGAVNVSKAIEVSCNYFFFESFYRYANGSAGTTLQGITMLLKYMELFGLKGNTGVEIEETLPIAASPEYKEQTMTSANPEVSPNDTRWMDGDTIRAAIGQSYNSFTPASMAKYIATLANGGTRYKTHLIDKMQEYDGSNEEAKVPEVESDLQISQENLDAVYKGMIAVTAGEMGTSRAIFESLPVEVAGKTGTAEEDKRRSNHTWFVGFAPFNDPEIAVAVMIPFGESSPSPSAIIARDVIGEYFEVNKQADTGIYENIIVK